MRKRRVRLKGERVVYHCLSRAVAGAHLFDDEAKTVFREMLWRVADFCGIEILAYCVMSNHFHILLRTPEHRKVEEITRDELVRRYARFYANRLPLGQPAPDVLAQIFREGPEHEAERWEKRLKARMGDVSEFMKTLKQCFAVWYNTKHQRFGTLWAERFTSLVVEDTTLARQTVAAYIALNPVRAGMVDDPGRYEWSSFGDASRGIERAREALKRVEDRANADDALRNHTHLLGEKGVRSENGRLRAMSAGIAIGSESFVRRIVAKSDPERRWSIRKLAKNLPSFTSRGLFVFGSLREVALRS